MVIDFYIRFYFKDPIKLILEKLDQLEIKQNKNLQSLQQNMDDLHNRLTVMVSPLSVLYFVGK